MEVNLIEQFATNKPDLTLYFSGGLTVVEVGFMYEVEMSIYHKKTNVIVAIKEEIFTSKMEYTEAFTDFLSEYFDVVELAALSKLRVIRRKPLEVHNESFLQACDEFLVNRKG